MHADLRTRLRHIARGYRTDAAIALLFIVLAVAMTWPLASNLGRAVADPGDPYINTWILDWVGHALVTQPTELFHANIFHPSRYSLAFSEHLILPAALLVPLRLVGVTPIAAHNVALLFGFAFTGFAAYLLGRLLTGSAIAGIAAGTFHAFLPFRFTHLAHVQHAFAGFLPLLLWALVLYLRRPQRREAAIFALVFLATGLTNVHWFFFGGFACAATVALMAVAGFREWKPLAIATAIACIALLPVFYPYAAAAKLYGMERQWSELLPQSAHLSDWLLNGFYTRNYASWRDPTVNPECWLFPGLIGLALAAVGTLVAPGGVRATSLLWIFIGVFGSLGANGAFHQFLFESVPGFRSIRSPARWAVIAYVGMAVLIAIAVAVVARRSRIVAMIIPLAFLYELHAAPVRWYMTDPDVLPVYEWLRKQPPRAIAELPIGGSDEYFYMLASATHHQPMINGVSGFAPTEFMHIARLANSDPISMELLDSLSAAGCELLILHRDRLGDREPVVRSFIARAADRLRLVRAFDEGIGGTWVFELRRSSREDPQLATVMSGAHATSERPFGLIDSPAPNAVVHGRLHVSGWVLAAEGIERVEIVVNNGSIRIPATLQRDARVSRLFPLYPRTPLPRFTATIEHPAGRWTASELHVVATSRDGRTVQLPSRWFTWQPR